MAEDIKLWRIITTEENRVLEEIPSKRMSDLDLKEEALQKWIIENPRIVSDDLTIIGKEIENIDILGINQDGTVVVIETKRDEPRGAVAQVIDYASFIAEKDEQWLRDKAKEKDIELPQIEEINLENPKMYIVGTSPNEEIERMVRFLSKYEMDINLVIIRCHKDEKGEYLSRTYFLTEETKKELSETKKRKFRKWDEQSYLGKMEELHGRENSEKIRHLIDKLKSSSTLSFRFGFGENPNLIIKDKDRVKTLVYLYWNGYLEIYAD